MLPILRNRQEKVIAGGLVFLVVLTILNVLITKKTQFASLAKPVPTAFLILNPETVNLAKDQIFNLEIVLDPGNHQVDAVDAILSYDPDLLEATGLAPAGLFPVYPIQEFAQGKVQLSAFGLTKEGKKMTVSKKGSLGTVTFKAKAQSGETTVSFSPDSIVAAKGESVLAGTKGTQVVIGE